MAVTGPVPRAECRPFSVRSRGPVLLEAVPAVYRAPLGGLERYLALLLAVRARRLVHFPGAAEASPAPVPVSVSHIIHSLSWIRPEGIRFAPSAALSGRHFAGPSSSLVCPMGYMFLVSKAGASGAGFGFRGADVKV